MSRCRRALTPGSVRSRLSAFVPALTFLIHLVPCAGDLRGAEPGGGSYRPHETGFASGLYHNRFIDDVISPAVYTASSPIYDLFYRYAGNTHKHALNLRIASYTAGLRDGVEGDDFVMIDSEGDTYLKPRSMHELKSTRVELDYSYAGRLARFHGGRGGFFLGVYLGIFGETLEGRDHWSSTMYWDKDKGQMSGGSFGIAGKLERNFRAQDRIALDFNFAVYSSVARLQYYSPLTMMKDYEQSEYSDMLPNKCLRWAATLTYMFCPIHWLGIEAGYRFQHQRVTEPRDLRYISHTFTIGVLFVIEKK